MAKTTLTDKAVSAAKAEAGKRIELSDAKVPGLCLRVSEAGKVWFYRYRTLDGRQPRLKLGDYSAKQGIAWARAEAEDLRPIIRRGGDPAAERRKAKEAARAEPVKTFGDLADAYLKACESGEWKPKNKRKRARTIEDEKGVLKRHIRPALGKRRLEDITRADVRKFLRGMTQAGIGAQTNKAHQVIRQCFAYAIAEERVTVNPATGFAPLAAQSPRTRTLADEEMKAFWGALVDPTGLKVPPSKSQPDGADVQVGRPVRIILQLALLLLQRRSEIAGMRLDELDLDQGLWLIGADRMKGGVPHMVPLPPSAVKLIKEACELAAFGRKEPPPVVFPSPRDASKAVLGNSVSHAMKELTAALGIDGVSVHDLRRTGSTALTSERLGVSPFIRSKVLGHRTDTGGGAAVSMAHYDRNEYLPEKRRALTAWEGLLEEIVTGQPRRSNVRQMGARA